MKRKLTFKNVLNEIISCLRFTLFAIEVCGVDMLLSVVVVLLQNAFPEVRAELKAVTIDSNLLFLQEMSLNDAWRIICKIWYPITIGIVLQSFINIPSRSNDKSFLLYL